MSPTPIWFERPPPPSRPPMAPERPAAADRSSSSIDGQPVEVAGRRDDPRRVPGARASTCRRSATSRT